MTPKLATTPSKTDREAATYQKYAEDKITRLMDFPLVKQITDILMEGFYYFLYMTLLYILLSLISYRYNNSSESGSKIIIMWIVFAMGLFLVAFYRFEGMLHWYKSHTNDDWSDFRWTLFVIFLTVSVLCVWNNFKNDDDTKYLLDIDDGFDAETSLDSEITNAFIKIKSNDPIASLDHFIIIGIIMQLIVMSTVSFTSKNSTVSAEEST